MHYHDTITRIRQRQEERERLRRAEHREDLVLSLVALTVSTLAVWAVAANAGEHVSAGEVIWLSLLVVLSCANALSAWASFCWLWARRRR